jgi:hypothetical protein
MIGVSDQRHIAGCLFIYEPTLPVAIAASRKSGRAHAAMHKTIVFARISHRLKQTPEKTGGRLQEKAGA